MLNMRLGSGYTKHWRLFLLLCHLRRTIAADLQGIWDGSSIRRSAELKSFLIQGGARFVWPEQFPPYVSDLNPDECVWRHLKHVELCNV